MEIVLHSEERPPYEESPELQTLLDTTEREIKRTVTADKKREATKRKTPAVARTTHEITYVSGPTERSPVGGSGDHTTWMRPTDTETIMLSGNAQFALENAEGRLSRRSRHTGLPTRKAWRLGYGDTRVFAKPPKNKGKVVCLVDLSGSMGCWCEACGNESSGGSSGWLAWQTVSVLSTRFPDMEVFGFIGRTTSFQCHPDNNHYAARNSGLQAREAKAWQAILIALRCYGLKGTLVCPQAMPPQ